MAASLTAFRRDRTRAAPFAGVRSQKNGTIAPHGAAETEPAWPIQSGCIFIQRSGSAFATLLGGALGSAGLTPSLIPIQHRQQKQVICRYFKPSDGLEPSTPSLSSSDEEGSAGNRGSRRPKNSRKLKESPEDE